LVIFIFGPGAFSIDWLISSYVQRRYGESPRPLAMPVSQRL
jgi:hypothetical protein